MTCGHDHTCRVWKVAEESHLIFRAHHPAIECCRRGRGGGGGGGRAPRAAWGVAGGSACVHARVSKGYPPAQPQHTPAAPAAPRSYITGTEWLSGANDGSLQVWTQLKKKPVSVFRGAHARPPPAGAPGAPPAAGSWATAGSEAAAWVQSVAVARGSDLAASGAGDGAVRLWAVEQSKHGGAGGVRPAGALPAAGFVNGLAIERRGGVVAAALGPETRLGRWGRVDGARAGLLVHRLEVAPEEEEEGDA